MTPQETLMATLRRALSLKRPHGSREEGLLLTSLLVPELRDVTWIDTIGNLHIDLRSNRRHKTLFVAHVDTVHTKGGVNRFDDSTPMWKAVESRPYHNGEPDWPPTVKAKMKLPKFVSTRDGALGADDGAGVAMLAGLIAARKPGYYIFTRGEECGGIGARFLADSQGDLLLEFDRAIAFDRKGVTSVITHQSLGRCCSDEFAEALSNELNILGLLYMPDDTGIYTDTAEFAGIIPECTNISVGYYHEHSDRECIDTNHLKALFDACLAIEFDKLPTRRDPSDSDDGFQFSFAVGKYDWGSPADTEPGGEDDDGAEMARWMRECAK
jgi:hypothetical protein